MNKIATPKFGVGASVLRQEDDRFLRGSGTYTTDVQAEGAKVAYMLRSPVAHARFTLEGLDDARASEGVHLVWTAADIAATNSMPCKAVLKQIDGSKHAVPPREVLCSDTLRHVGDAYAFVVADTLEQAKNAAEMIELDYDDMPVALGTRAVLQDDAPLVWPEYGSNVAFELGQGDAEGTAAAMAGAAKTVSLELVNNRVISNYMETRACIGAYDAESDRFTLTAGTQGGHGLRDIIAEDILGIEAEKLRVITPDVGGGFGTKMFCYREYPLVLLAAKALGAPVRWSGERMDHFVTDAHGRDNVSKITAGFDEANRIVALDVEVTANMGAYLHQYGPFIPHVGTSMTSGLYDIPRLFAKVIGVYSHTVPVDAYRGAGRPEAAYLIERFMEHAAHELQVDPAELRRANFIKTEALPYTTATGRMYDTGDFAGHMDKALAEVDYAGFAARAEESRRAGRYRGIGISSYVEACAFPGSEEAKVELGNDGRVTLYIGTQSNGQGHATAYGQVVAELLGLSVDDVVLVQGDTDRVRKGGGTGGSRSIPLGVTSVRGASCILAQKIKEVASEKLEADAADLELVEGNVQVVGTHLQLSLADVAAAAPDVLSGLDEVQQDECTYPNGTHICELEVDPQTGVTEIVNFVIVDDFGVSVNPLLLEGQVHGGAGQAVAQALYEQTVYDEDGQLLTASLLDYHLPRADNMPAFNFQTRNVPSTTNAMGIKGAGEAGTIGACAAVMNALTMALRDNGGVRHIDMPATPHRVWQALQAAGGGQ
ncbi:xanthine dehydrogenase family protein molybdopterin-binding subunit [Polycladidibacter hongkongensis]|uniref:xanthine dehydrogenase family protein molybdopterin-binding subunit n=1 Tax=Polycladidibacter hongkongensis TaxID=1647556 RepID=UPI00082CBDA1|nr:xanthine dehydrogenase family protein molybdopterin-binding subunit [Pseudovibrio hongkongensis]